MTTAQLIPKSGPAKLVTEVGRLGASLADYVGHPAYNVGELRQDQDRFTFLLGGDDGESLFGPG